MPFHKQRHAIAGVLLLGVAGLLQSVAYGGSQAPELLGASKKSVGRILGDGQPLASGLFNEESSESHSGGIGSTHAYRTRIGYLRDRSCYSFFMKKTGEGFNPIEVFGLLYLCANRGVWRELEADDQEIGFIYQATNSKGVATGRTCLATLDETEGKLFVYSPEWRPDFNRELWITPDEAPVHREAERGSVIGKLPRRSNSKQANLPETSLFGKSASAPDPKRVVRDPKRVVREPKQVVRDPKRVVRDPKRVVREPKQVVRDSKRVGIDPKQGIYLPQLNQVVPDDPGKESKAGKKRGKRKKRRQKQAKPIVPSGK